MTSRWHELICFSWEIIGREIWQQSKSSFQEKTMDIHTKLMSKYNQVPEWWFVSILLANIALTVFACEYYNDQLQLPWWGVLLACGIAIFFTLPIGIITAITNQAPGLNIITEYIIGYIYPGYPVANMCFKVYGYISMTQAITFLQDFKLGHYMKIPPRTMFMAQVNPVLLSSCQNLKTRHFLNLLVLVLGCWNLDSQLCVFGHCLVALGNRPRHMQLVSILLDLPVRYGVLRCLSDMGVDRSSSDFWRPWILFFCKLVLPCGCNCSCFGMVSHQGISTARVDQTCQHACIDCSHRIYASSHRS